MSCNLLKIIDIIDLIFQFKFYPRLLGPSVYRTEGVRNVLCKLIYHVNIEDRKLIKLCSELHHWYVISNIYIYIIYLYMYCGTVITSLTRPTQGVVLGPRPDSSTT